MTRDKRHQLIALGIGLMCFGSCGGMMMYPRYRYWRLHYDPRAICSVAFNKTLDFGTSTSNPILVTMGDGCFGPLIRLPANWHNPFIQPSGDQNGFWYSFWPVGDAYPQGPYETNQAAGLAVNGRYFRMQGHGTAALYTNDTAETKPSVSTDPPGFTDEFCPPGPNNPGMEIGKNDSRPLQVKITIEPSGCFLGPYKMPKEYRHAIAHWSGKKGQWVSFWVTKPYNAERWNHSRIYRDGEDFDPDEWKKISEFYIQGVGTLTIQFTGYAGDQ